MNFYSVITICSTRIFYSISFIISPFDRVDPAPYFKSHFTSGQKNGNNFITLIGAMEQLKSVWRGWWKLQQRTEYVRRIKFASTETHFGVEHMLAILSVSLYSVEEEVFFSPNILRVSSKDTMSPSALNPPRQNVRSKSHDQSTNICCAL